MIGLLIVAVGFGYLLRAVAPVERWRNLVWLHTVDSFPNPHAEWLWTMAFGLTFPGRVWRVHRDTLSEPAPEVSPGRYCRACERAPRG